jgi:bacillithiol system protein YtxJ
MSRLAGIPAGAWLVALSATHLSVLYKHSPICGSSRRAKTEVSDFMSGHPEARVFLLDVIAERALAGELATLLGVTHESPQVILLEGRTVVWHGSHEEITAEVLGRAYDLALGSDGVSRRT